MNISKKRDYYFDNAKFILIFLVVIGHFIEPTINTSRFTKIMFMLIYLFHMPAFIFISGYFSKDNVNTGWLIKLIKKFLIPYMLVQLIFIWFTKFIGLTNYNYTLITPAYIYWYLFAMLIWNIGIRIVAKFNVRIEYTIIASFIVSIIIGYASVVSWKLSLSRIIIFFPYFLLGYFYKSKDLKPKLTIKNRKIAITIMITIFVILTLYNRSININWLYCADSYEALNLYGINGPIYRITLYIAQILMVFAFFRIIQDHENKFTTLGSKTLNIYVLHGFLIKLLVSTQYYNAINISKILLLIGFSIVTVFCLGKLNLKKLV